MPKKKTSLIRSADFKTVYAVGAIGTWTPYDFRINFYSEKVAEENEEAYVNDAQVILSPKAIKEFAYWLMKNVNDYEATQGKTQTGDSPEGTGNEDGKFIGDLRTEIKEDLKSELEGELQKYMATELSPKINKKLSTEIKSDLQKYFRQNIQDDLRKKLKVMPTTELKKDLKKVLKADLRQEMGEDIKKDIREEIKRDLRVTVPGHLGAQSTQLLRTKTQTTAKDATSSTRTKNRRSKKLDTKTRK